MTTVESNVAGAFDEGTGEPRGRMHRQIEGDEVRSRKAIVSEAVTRGIDAVHFDASRAQRRGRRGETQWLAPQVVGRDQQDSHHDQCTGLGEKP